MKERVAKFFGALGGVIAANPKNVLLVTLFLPLVLLPHLKKLEYDNSVASFISDADPSMADYLAFRNTFGHDSILLIGISDPKIFSAEFLQNLWEFHSALEESVPHYDEISSLVTVRNVYTEDVVDEDVAKESENAQAGNASANKGANGEVIETGDYSKIDEGDKLELGGGKRLVLEDLVKHFPQTEQEIAAFKTKVMANPFYRNFIISPDHNMTTIVIRLRDDYMDEKTGDVERITDVQVAELVTATQKVAKDFKARFEGIYISGSPIITVGLNHAVHHDMKRFVIASLAMILVILFWLFRRISAVLVPLIIVSFSAIITFGLMAVWHQPIQSTTIILPSFIIVVGVCNSIHFLTHFFREFDITGDKIAAIEHALNRTGQAMMMASLTTAVGLLSFVQANIKPIVNIGIFGAIGVILAFVLTVIFLPAFLSILPIRQRKESIGAMHSLPFGRFIDKAVDIVEKHSLLVLAICLIVFVVAAGIASGLTYSHNPLAWFPDEQNLRKSTSQIDTVMGGSIPIEVIITTRTEGIGRSPQFLKKLDIVAQAMTLYRDEIFEVGKVLSVTDIIKETHQALNNNDPDYYRLPDTAKEMDHILAMLDVSAPNILYRQVDKEFRQMRHTLIIHWADALHYYQLQLNIKRIYEEALGDEAEVIITGQIPLLANTLDGVIQATATSYFLSVGFITVMMILMMGNIKYGFVSMLPNIFPVVVTLAIMRLMGTPLDLFTMMIGSIAMGLVVEDTIHFMHSFLRFRELGMSPEKAVAQTLHTSGRAMLMTSIVLALGFLVFTFSKLTSLFHFGFLSAICVVLAILSDFFMSPALMMHLSGSKKNKDIKAEEQKIQK